MKTSLDQSFRITGWLEGASLLILLFIAMPLKYMADMPLAVRIVGSAHGLLFVVYCLFAIYLADKKNWSIVKLVICWILSCLPFGTFYFEWKLLNKN